MIQMVGRRSGKWRTTTLRWRAATSHWRSGSSMLVTCGADHSLVSLGPSCNGGWPKKPPKSTADFLNEPGQADGDQVGPESLDFGPVKYPRPASSLLQRRHPVDDDGDRRLRGLFVEHVQQQTLAVGGDGEVASVGRRRGLDVHERRVFEQCP